MSTNNPPFISDEVVAAVKEQLAQDALLPARVKTSDWIETRARVLANLEPTRQAFVRGLNELGVEAAPALTLGATQGIQQTLPLPPSKAQHLVAAAVPAAEGNVTLLLDVEGLQLSSEAPNAGTPAELRADTDHRSQQVTSLSRERAVQPDPPPGMVPTPGTKPQLSIVKNRTPDDGRPMS